MPATYRKPPLQDLSILVTRPEKQARKFVQELENAGARTHLLPTIVTVPPPDWLATDRAITELALYQWLIFSSVNGVEAFLQRFREKQGDEKSLSQIKIVSVGPETARAIQAAGLHCTLIAKEYAAEGLIELFADRDLKGHRILLPRALKARELLPETLRRQGAEVNVVAVYQTIFPPQSSLLLEELLRCRKIDIITLTSASTANNLVENCHHPAACSRLRKITTACIGPITAAAATAAGLQVKIVAPDYTSAGLLQALIDFAANNPTLKR